MKSKILIALLIALGAAPPVHSGEAPAAPDVKAPAESPEEKAFEDRTAGLIEVEVNDTIQVFIFVSTDGRAAVIPSLECAASAPCRDIVVRLRAAHKNLRIDIPYRTA
jgi:hypothetical protein